LKLYFQLNLGSDYEESLKYGKKLRIKSALIKLSTPNSVDHSGLVALNILYDLFAHKGGISEYLKRVVILKN
jgi:hypothetical protein